MPALEFTLVYPLAAMVLAALARRYVPGLASLSGQLVLCVLVTAVAYRGAVLGYFLWIAAPYGAAVVFEKLARGKAARLIRWRFAIIAMLSVVGVFGAGTFHLLDSAAVTIAGVTWMLPDRDMWLLIRLITFF